MSDFILHTAVKAQGSLAAGRDLLQSFVARLAADERGQDAIEYVGVLAVVAVVIGIVIMVAGKLQAPILSGASKEITSIFK